MNTDTEVVSSKPKHKKKITKKYLKQQEKKLRNKLDKEWSFNVKKVFNNKCAILNCNNSLLHTHHLIPREIKESRHDVNNGICLCAYHHKFSLEISPHRNPLVFFNWYFNNYKERFTTLYNKYLKIFK